MRARREVGGTKQIRRPRDDGRAHGPGRGYQGITTLKMPSAALCSVCRKATTSFWTCVVCEKVAIQVFACSDRCKRVHARDVRHRKELKAQGV
jgi:hypothetical protein